MTNFLLLIIALPVIFSIVDWFLDLHDIGRALNHKPQKPAPTYSEGWTTGEQRRAMGIED